MDVCDVLVVGGGPAGSSCARRLRQAGLDVLVVDRAEFPRDKVCAGWITPQVVADLALDTDDYRRRHTFQPITGFRTGLVGRTRVADTQYDSPVSYGIRRCEFDNYLLERSGARLRLGEGVVSIRRDRTRARWIVNEEIEAPMLVGAGGHFCPVARKIHPEAGHADLVVAQEAEFPIDDERGWMTAPGMPELYFSGDLKGYGWIFRKGRHLNIGLGRVDRHSLPGATADFVAFLRARQRIPAGAPLRWRGHAYLLSSGRRRTVDEGVVLVGDAAGLAYPASGEGIRPAIESGLLAASAIIAAAGEYASERLSEYDTQLRARLGPPLQARESSSWRSAVSATLAPWLFGVPWFVRHQVLNRWFLRTDDPPLALS